MTTKGAATEPGWALILGVTGGSGSAIARAVARDPGLDVIGFHRGRRPEAAQALTQAFAGSPRALRFVVAGAGTAEEAIAGCARLPALLGGRRIKLFVHAIANASVGRLVASREERLDARRIEKTFEAMAHSFVYWIQALHDNDLLDPTGARLLGLSNPMGDVVVRGTAAIAATKAALAAYVRHLAHELGPAGHRVNLLKFGAMPTEAVRRTFADAAGLQRIAERATPARRLCTGDEVAAMVSVLAGEAGAWFNGAVIDFTGGEFQGLMSLLLERETGGEP